MLTEQLNRNTPKRKGKKMGKHSAPSDPTMRRLLAGAVIVPAGLTTTAVLASASAYATVDERGANAGAEKKSTGPPINPDGFGSVTSQVAVDDDEATIGSHVSSQDTPHLGVGNVSRNDKAEFDAARKVIDPAITDTGTRPGDHAFAIGPLFGYDPLARPGTKEEEDSVTTVSTGGVSTTVRASGGAIVR
jgi:hypothetical protein